MMITIINDINDYYHKRREGGGQRVTIEIIISENDDNDGRSLSAVKTLVKVIPKRTFCVT